MSNLGNLMNYSEPLQPNSVDIRTEYLEPISSSTYKYVFRLDQSGYLDTNSMLTFKLQSVGADQDGKCRVNPWNGVLGGIKRVIFQVGDNIINDVQDVYKYATLKNMNMPESMRNKYLGHYLGNSFHTTIVENSTKEPDGESNQSFAQASNLTNGAYAYQFGRSGVDFGKADGTSTNLDPNSLNINNDTSKNHQYGITLGMLIPALKGQRIPLFVFDKQRILLTFEFNKSDKFCVNTKNANLAYNTGQTCIAASTDVIPNDVRMVVDYIVVPTDVQNDLLAQTQKEGGYRLEFYDVVNVEKNLPQGTNGEVQEVEHRIGQNNREVHNIIMWKENNSLEAFTGGAAMTPPNSKRGNQLLGEQACVGFGQEEYNCNIDGKDEFDHMVYNPISQYNELSAVLGSDLKVIRPMYVVDDNTCASKLAQQEDGTLGTFKPLGLSLRNGIPSVVGGGRMIGNYPIVWKYSRKCHSDFKVNGKRDDHATKVNYFIEVSRVANILNTAQGTNVVVSY
jgi:hypothetical protein